MCQGPNRLALQLFRTCNIRCQLTAKSKNLWNPSFSPLPHTLSQHFPPSTHKPPKMLWPFHHFFLPNIILPSARPHFLYQRLPSALAPHLEVVWKKNTQIQTISMQPMWVPFEPSCSSIDIFVLTTFGAQEWLILAIDGKRAALAPESAGNFAFYSFLKMHFLATHTTLATHAI